MKKIIIAGIIILLSITILGVIGYSYYENTIMHPFTKKGNIELRVNNGDNLNTLLKRVNDEKLIRNIYIIKYYIKHNNLNVNIKPGNYSFTDNSSISEIVNDLNLGKLDPNIASVTIPEGYTIDQIGQRLEDKGIMSKDTFINGCKSYKLPEDINTTPKRKYALEGYLFPDTYEMKKGMSSEAVIKLMLNRFNVILNEIELSNNKTLNKDEKDKLVIMASLIEGEAEEKDERAIISGVFFNRLKLGMKLQSCASVEYILTSHKVVLSNKDIQSQSPYNTYLVDGLPEGPIGNAGKASLEAALNPTKTNYLYFVAKFDGTGGHFFSENLAKHNEAIKVSEANMKKLGI